MKRVLRKALELWQHHRVSRVAAALSFYAIFTVPASILMVVWLARAGLGPSRGLPAVDAELAPLIGAKGTQGLNTLVAASQHKLAAAPIVIGAALLLAAVFGIFMQVQEALDDVWDIPEHRRGGVKEIVVLRLHVVIVVVALALLALLALFGAAAGGRAGAIGLNAVAIILFLTVAYRVLPRADVAWKSCALGAVITGAVLLLGEAAIAFYLTRFHPESGYGEAGSTIVLLIWVYYSALLFLFGAILTRALEDA
ncbi:MAG TPA: YihY/virulence factor BrkB family protein [Candidatus Baltobacteraceae bacterium]|jgi:membrane protein